jgi:peptide/nickel transport system substrate-binding protein
MRTTLRRTSTGHLWLSLLLCMATVGVGACVDGDDVERGGRLSGQAGGTIRAAYTSFPDFLDPALSYTQSGWQSLWLVYTPLLTYKHVEGMEGTRLIPGLAEALPEVSPDGRTYRLRLREGLQYSDGTAVKASDFERTIQRVLRLESGGAAFYLKIAGAQTYGEDDDADADISGIETDDATGEIVIRLHAPDGSFPNILAMNFAALVPGDTPFANQTTRPPAGVGPYRLENVRLNRGYDLVKVPAFDVEGIPQGKLDKITIEVVKNRRRQTQDTAQNMFDYMFDPPAPDQLRMVKQRYEGERYQEFVTNSTYYLFLNERVPPFDKREVRRAVNHAIDRRATARLSGARRRQGQAAHRAGGRQGRRGHCVGQRRAGVQVDGRVRRRRAQPDRAEGQAADRRGARLLRDDRQPEDEGPDRLHELVSGLPAPVELHVLGRRRFDSEHQQPEPRQRRRRAHQRGPDPSR